MNQDNVNVLGSAPFGLRMGMTTEAVGAELDELHAFTFAAPVPKPHPDFYRYILTITPQAGLARISALSNRVPTDRAGAELRAAFAVQAAELAATHGSYQVIDTPVVGHRRPAPHRWMHALGHEAYVLLAQWSAHQGSALGGGLSAITLEAWAAGSKSGCFTIYYNFANEAQADAEIAAWRRRAG
jgi:hypothetical protein